METYTTEEQEIEAVKKWWAENGVAIVLGIVIGLSGLFGWRGYQAHQAELAIAASDLYESMLVSTRADDAEKAKVAGEQILRDYEGTQYAIFSAMILARQAVDEADMERARQHLQFAIDNADDEELQSLATLRLARVAYAEGNFDETLSLLSNELDGYVAAAAELKGDVYTRQGDFSKAREEYALALSEGTSGSGTYDILEMKLDATGNRVN